MLAYFGRRVCVPGDLDGDGQSDLLVSSTHVFVGAGAVYAYSGLDGALLWTAIGEADGDALGEALEPIGDLDGDGVVDIAIGSHDAQWTGVGFTNPGYVRVVSGVTGQQILRFDAGEDSADGSWFGARLAHVGDVNGDGVPELLVGIRNWSGSAFLGGRIQLHSLGLRSLRPDVTTVSVATGGTQLLRLRPGPEWAGALYVLAGSATGSVPELPLLGPGGPHTLPLVLDAYTTATLAAPGAFLAGSVGILSETGIGLATLMVPSGLGPALVGASVQHAFVLLDPAQGVTFASNAAPLLLAP
ncbi:MAG TPA: VCBS repeat-containing protein [Planctomycetota bacterium]|nr:VCBS repeat-containing protein [Planctomycetota bacterium]